MEAYRPGGWGQALALCGLLGLAISGFYLSIYAVNDLDEPIGWDTASYVWRTNCVAEGGLQHLFVCVPHNGRSLPSRIGYPLVTIPIAWILSASRITFAAVFPAAAAASIGIASGALGTTGTGSAPTFALIATVVATSPMVVQLAFQYADTMIALILVLGAFIIVLRLVVDGKGFVAAATLLATGAIVHWPTAAVLGASLGIAVLPLVRNDWRTIRSGGRPGSTVSARVGVALGGGALLWGGAIGGLVQAPIDTFRSDPAAFARKLRAVLPAYGLPISVPAAALGARHLWRRTGRADAPASLLFWLFCAWSGLIAAGLAAWFLGVRRIPPNRLLVLALPIPILASFGLMWVAQTIRVRSKQLARASIVVASAAALSVGYFVWLEIGVSTLHSRYLRDAHTAADYLERVAPDEADVVIVVRGPGTTAARVIENLRVALPPERIGHVRIDVRHADEDNRSFSDIEGPTVLLLESFSPSFDELADSRPTQLAAPNLLVARGAMATGEIHPRPAPVITMGFPATILLSVATIIILAVVGYGWTLAATGGSLRLLERLAVAQAVGLAVIVLSGLVADRIGVSHAGPAGAWCLVIAGASGFAAAAVARNVRGRGP